ncbi:dimethylamine monooxygenase subunit DmmA family protein [Sutcliffiella halmapala]|uniref:dimethylamine monooxygenase subunit DmmA family protein n=1 Tax=Sutcliffiella halmapala TaxID=79882 RepID=UPI00111630F2|nr:dimethylamine monooxygenase subunit DmmA family protein [Sutcliffiella halmapala]
MMFRKQTATYIPHKRHYLFCLAKKNQEYFAEIIANVKANEQIFETFYIKENIESILDVEDLKNWLGKQKMGTYLYIAASWNVLKGYKDIVESVGFSDEEAQYIAVGSTNRKVFCCRCHGVMELKVEELIEINNQITCTQCELNLSVSDHYSKLRDAYLGYPTFI